MAWQKKQNRAIAMSAVRSEMRKQGVIPERQSGKTAITILDDLCRVEPDKRFARWYDEATDNEICTFIREWNKWAREKARSENR